MIEKKRTGPVIHGSDAAPLIYFDGILAWGIHNNVLQIELAANHLIPSDLNDGPVKVRVAVTAHLRCSPTAARQLADMLDDALGVSGDKEKS